MNFRYLALLLCSCALQAKSISTLSSYEDSYALATYTSDINTEAYAPLGAEEEDVDFFEIKFQFSASVPILPLASNTALMASYTQKSLWQALNSDASSPFRETNYKPQLFIANQSNMLVFNHFEVGYKHESNGRAGAISRSWDRGYIALERFQGPIEYGIHTWVILRTEQDDIDDYYAPYEMWFKMHSGFGEFNTRGFYNFSSNKGGIEAGYNFPMSKVIGFYVQAYHGYGETMIDYNLSQTRIGVGVKLINL
ncbi:phospholipase A [Vibrio makurazakiensis]|uniref:phospholipase A n=1 Tax=Vibrio makurazakiensis TaxID=2910250 RepID=UPI003D0E1C8F